MTLSQDKLSAEAVRVLRQLKQVSAQADAEQHSIQTMRLAEIMLSLRQFYLTPEGNPDWSGQTWAYRDAVRGLYGAADYNPAERASTQSTVRTRVADLIHERLSPEEREAAGITSRPPRERRKARHQRQANLIEALQADIDPEGPLADKVTALRGILTTLTKERIKKRDVVAPENVSTAKEYARLLSAIRDRADDLVGQLRGLRVID